jgi:hypothetical protein
VNVTLHEKQSVVFHDPARYKVVAAGRRFGKSYLAAVTLFVEAAKNYKTRSDGKVIDLSLEEVYYVAPTFEQGKKILWPLLKEIGHDLIDQKYENTGTLTLKNGRRISIKGADRPDSLRGVGLSYVVLDEYAFMKEEVWEMIISPALSRSEGGALFIGTPRRQEPLLQLVREGSSRRGARVEGVALQVYRQSPHPRKRDRRSPQAYVHGAFPPRDGSVFRGFGRSYYDPRHVPNHRSGASPGGYVHSGRLGRVRPYRERS